MDELTKIILTSSLTIIGGVIIFVIGQFISKFVIDPVNDLRQVIGKTDLDLLLYSKIYTNPKFGSAETRIKVMEGLQQNAYLLESKASMVKWNFGVFEDLGITPKKDSIRKASEELVLLSNSLAVASVKENIELERKIRELLNLKII